jgi:hypothetical protein
MQRVLKDSERESYISLLEHIGITPERSLQSLTSIGDHWANIHFPYGVALGKELFSMIAYVAKYFGDSEFVIIDTFSMTPNEYAVACLTEYDEFKQALNDHRDFVEFDVVVLGHSGKWVVIMQGLDDGVLATDGALKEQLLSLLPWPLDEIRE